MQVDSNTQIVFARSKEELVTSPHTLKEAADAFFILHVARQSDSYRDWLESRLRFFIDFLGPELLLEKITIWQLELWYTELASRDTLYEEHPYREPVSRSLSPSTLKGHVKAVKTFFNWLGKRRLIGSNPAALLEFPSIPERPPKHASRTEVVALLDHFEKNDMARNYVAVRILVATGLRAGGLVGLRAENVDFSDRLLTVSEKGRGGQQKSRTVPVDRSAASALRAHLGGRQAGYVFRSAAGAQWSTHALYQVLERASRSCGLHRTVGPHMLRHYFGFESIRRGLNLRLVQQIMGHASSKTTEIYTKFKPVELRDAYDAVYGTNGTDPRLVPK